MNVVRYDPARIQFEQTQCAICLVDYQLNERVNKLACHHIYHRPCWQEWAKRNASCPLCRIQKYPEEVGEVELSLQQIREVLHLIGVSGDDQAFFERHRRILEDLTPLQRYQYIEGLGAERRRFTKLCFTFSLLFEGVERFRGAKDLLRDWKTWQQRYWKTTAMIGILAGAFLLGHFIGYVVSMRMND